MDINTALTFIGMTVPFFLLTIWALVDISMKQFPTPSEKAIWWLVALIPFAGWLIYLVLGLRRGKRPEKE